MSRILQFGKRLRALVWKPPVETEVGDELAHHFDLLVQQGVARGLSREQAEDEARRRFGAAEPVRTECVTVARSRDRRATARDWLDRLATEIRWAYRSLRGAPSYSTAMIGTIGLVIAANALVFGVVAAILLRPLPYPDSDRLVALSELTAGGDRWELSWPNFDDWTRASKTLGSTAGWFTEEGTLRTEAKPRIRYAVVTGDFFGTLASPPALGRPLTVADQSGANGRPVVLSHRAWRTHFGADPEVVGKSLSIDKTEYIVVGVMPAAFRFPDEDIALWAPLGPPPDWMRNRSVHVVTAIGRLAPGRSIAEAGTELATIVGQIDRGHPGEDPEHRASARKLHDAVVGSAQLTLLVLLGGVAVILLIAIVNLAGLTLSRAIGRDGELAVRAALGASRAALARQLVIECLGLGLAGGLVGLGLALIGAETVIALLPRSLPRPNQIGIDPMVGLATVGLGLTAGLTIGLLAAARAARPDLAGRLNGIGVRSTGGAAHLAAQRVLVAAQVGLSLVLAASAGLLIRSVVSVQRVDPGFRADGLVFATVQIDGSGLTAGQVVDWYRDLPERLGRRGFAGASATSALPVSGGDGQGDLTVEGRSFPPGTAPAASYRRVLPGYFEAIGVPLIRGRGFDDRDRGGDPMIVIVSSALASRMWPGDDPIGKRIKVGPPDNEPWLKVVCVVGDVRNIGLDVDPGFDTYEPLGQRPRLTMTVVARAKGAPEGALEPLRAAITGGDPSVSVWGLSTMKERIARSLQPRLFPTRVMAAFGVLAMILAVVGVYGVTSYTVSRRRRELAIRMTLGAKPRQVEGMVIGQAFRTAGIGVGLGLAAALLATRWLTGMLYGIKPTDPIALGGAVVVLLTAALASAWLPGRRAARTDPATVIREQQ